MDCKKKLEQYLNANRVQFSEMRHPLAFTAQDVAATQHIPGKQFAKVVMVVANNLPVMLVLPAIYRIQFARLRECLGTPDVRLAQEDEFQEIFPDCETGAMPPFGNLYGVPVCVEQSLTDDEEIVFQAGSHRETLKIAYKDYARLVKPIIAAFALRQKEILMPTLA